MKKKSRNEVLVENYPFGSAQEAFRNINDKNTRLKQQELLELQNQKRLQSSDMGSSKEHSFGVNYSDPFALDQMINSFFFRQEESQTQKPDQNSRHFQSQQSQSIHRFFEIKVQDEEDDYDKDNVPHRNKQGKIQIHCPEHRKYKPKYFCVEPKCTAGYRVCCKDCIVEGPHKLHKNEPIEYLEKEVENIKKPMQKTFVKYQNLVKEVQEPFQQLKTLFENSMNLVMEHYLKEMLPEMRKLYNIKDFMDAVGDKFEIATKYKNRTVNEMVYKVISEDEREEFLNTVRPDREKIELFMRFVEERTDKLKEYSKEFLKHLLPNFLQEVNYNRLIEWEEEQKQKKLAEKKKYFQEHGIEINDNDLELQSKQKKKAKKDTHTDIKGEITNVFQKHKSAINDIIAFNDNYSVTCSKDQTIKVMDTVENMVYKDLDFKAGPVNQLVKLSDKYAASSHSDGSIRLIDVMNGLEVEKLQVDQDRVSCIQKQNEDLLIYGTFNGNIGFINYNTLDIDKYHINAHSSKVHCLGRINDKEFATGSNTGEIILWNTKKEKITELKGGHDDAVLNIIAMDKYNLITNCYNKKIIHWSLDDFTIQQEYYAYDFEEIMDEYDAPKQLNIEWKMKKLTNELLVSAGEDCCVKVWNYKTGKVLKYLPGHKGSIYSLAVSDNGQFIVSGDRYGQVVFWK